MDVCVRHGSLARRMCHSAAGTYVPFPDQGTEVGGEGVEPSTFQHVGDLQSLALDR